MILFKPVSDAASIASFKKAWYDGLSAPMDGMWDSGFINSSPHILITENGDSIGYCVENDDSAVLQFYLIPSHEHRAREIFRLLIEHRSVTGAIVQTIDPLFLSLSLENHVSLSIHTYLYQLQSRVDATHPSASGTVFEPVGQEELMRVIDFQIACLNGNEGLRSWLTDYSGNLLERSELFVLRRGTDWIGLGKYRKSDTQMGVADLGVMVHPGHRGNRWAAYILALLAEMGSEQGHEVICSTTVENLPSQKAITQAGFVSRNRILSVEF